MHIIWKGFFSREMSHVMTYKEWCLNQDTMRLEVDIQIRAFGNASWDCNETVVYFFSILQACNETVVYFFSESPTLVKSFQYLCCPTCNASSSQHTRSTCTGLHYLDT